MPLRIKVRGEFGAVYGFVRDNNDYPADKFLEVCEGNFQTRFRGSFDVLAKTGCDYESYVRFRSLHNEGKPLWEFKEHAHRIYAAREIFTIGEGRDQQKIAVVILFNGWKKGKDGKAKEEKIRIATAQTLYAEYLRTRVRNYNGEQESLAIATERAHRNRR